MAMTQFDRPGSLFAAAKTITLTSTSREGFAGSRTVTSGDSFAYHFSKRVIDIVGSLAGLTLLSPVFLMLYIIVLLDSPGGGMHRRRVLAKQDYSGGTIQDFDAFKFRTMIVNADDYLAENPDLMQEYQKEFKLVSDPRVTSVGAWMRRLSLDELPQLWNVLCGQMSLVGPRMITHPELSNYGSDSARLLSVKPGLTGLWQVSGRSDVSYAERVRLDIYYIEERSLRLDIEILLSTVKCVSDRVVGERSDSHGLINWGFSIKHRNGIMTMFPNSTPNHSNGPIPPGLIHDVLAGSQAMLPLLGKDVRPITSGSERNPDHSNIFVRKCVVSDADYLTKEAEKEPMAPRNSMTDAETNDLLDLLLAGVVNIRAHHEAIEATAAVKNAELNAELYDLYDCFMADHGRITRQHSLRPSEAYEQLLTEHTESSDETAGMSVAEYIDACAKRGMAFADGSRVQAILSFRYDGDNPAIAGQAFRCGSMLILSLPGNARVADSCVRMLITSAENEYHCAGESVTGPTDTWTVTYQQIFDNRFEVSPFTDPVAPEAPFAVQIIPNKDTKYCSSPCLLRDRVTRDLLAWVREGHYEEDLSVIHNELARAKAKQEAEREYYRQESAWEMMQWLASEELTQEYNEEGRSILVDEVGPERAEAMWDAARIVASLFPLFLLPRPDQP